MHDILLTNAPLDLIEYVIRITTDYTLNYYYSKRRFKVHII